MCIRDSPTTVKADVPGGVDIENTAAQVVNYYNPTTKKVEKPNKQMCIRDSLRGISPQELFL